MKILLLLHDCAAVATVVRTACNADRALAFQTQTGPGLDNHQPRNPGFTAEETAPQQVVGSRSNPEKGIDAQAGARL